MTTRGSERLKNGSALISVNDRSQVLRISPCTSPPPLGQSKPITVDAHAVAAWPECDREFEKIMACTRVIYASGRGGDGVPISLTTTRDVKYHPPLVNSSRTASISISSRVGHGYVNAAARDATNVKTSVLCLMAAVSLAFYARFHRRSDSVIRVHSHARDAMEDVEDREYFSRVFMSVDFYSYIGSACRQSRDSSLIRNDNYVKAIRDG